MISLFCRHILWARNTTTKDALGRQYFDIKMCEMMTGFRI